MIDNVHLCCLCLASISTDLLSLTHCALQLAVYPGLVHNLLYRHCDPPWKYLQLGDSHLSFRAVSLEPVLGLLARNEGADIVHS